MKMSNQAMGSLGDYFQNFLEKGLFILSNDYKSVSLAILLLVMSVVMIWVVFRYKKVDLKELFSAIIGVLIVLIGLAVIVFLKFSWLIFYVVYGDIFSGNLNAIEDFGWTIFLVGSIFFWGVNAVLFFMLIVILRDIAWSKRKSVDVLNSDELGFSIELPSFMNDCSYYAHVPAVLRQGNHIRKCYLNIYKTLKVSDNKTDSIEILSQDILKEFDSVESLRVDNDTISGAHTIQFDFYAKRKGDEISYIYLFVDGLDWLYTLECFSHRCKWNENKDDLKRAVESFRLL